jgi:hypothetical protein
MAYHLISDHDLETTQKMLYRCLAFSWWLKMSLTLGKRLNLRAEVGLDDACEGFHSFSIVQQQPPFINLHTRIFHTTNSRNYGIQIRTTIRGAHL